MQQIEQNNICHEEDEIDLRELFSTILKYKFKIALFTIVITTFSILYAISVPNSYKSTTMLVSQTQAKPSLGGLGALAGMAGIDLGGSGSIDTATSLDTVLKDFAFEEYMIKKYNLADKLLKVKKENLVFALGYDGIYNLLHSDNKEEKKADESKKIFDTYKIITSIISIVSDKKTSLITLSVEHQDRFLAKELAEIYLKELTSHLRDIEMKTVDSQLEYYSKELETVYDLSVKEQLGQLISGLVQKKVLSQANEFYNLSQFTKPQVAYIKDKTKPKRALIVIVAFITSIILGIFGVFFLEFLKNDEEEVIS